MSTAPQPRKFPIPPAASACSADATYPKHSSARSTNWPSNTTKPAKMPKFQAELASLLKNYVGRPSPLYHAKRLTEQCGGAQIWLKREDLNHTGAHKINNTIGQALLTLRMGKKRVIAETGAGQHGVATATACAHFGLDCVVYMGEEDIRRQAPNVFSMKLLGAEVRPVSSGSRTLRDAINEAMRDWMSERRNDALHPRLRRRPASVSADRPRFSSGDRPRNDRAIARATRPACPIRSSPVSAAAATRPACSIRSSNTKRSHSSASKPAAAATSPATTPPRSATAAPASSTAASAT